MGAHTFRRNGDSSKSKCPVKHKRPFSDTQDQVLWSSAFTMGLFTILPENTGKTTIPSQHIKITVRTLFSSVHPLLLETMKSCEAPTV